MILRWLCLLFCLFLAGTAARAEVLIFAAASLKEPVDQIAARFDNVVVSYGGSGTMARQIGQGAPADLVLLANPVWMDVLLAGGDVDAATVTDFASNRLVLIGPAGAAPFDLTEAAILSRLDGGRLALGMTQSVPAGIYAKAALEHLGLWQALSEHLAEVDNVRAARALVARKQAALGLVYASDAQVADDVVAVAAIPPAAHPPIRYVGAVTSTSTEPTAAQILDFITGPEGQAILSEAGFLPPEVSP